MKLRYWDHNLKIRLLGEAMFNMLFWMYFPFIAVYFSDALGGRIAGVLMAVPPVFSLIGSMLGGNLADRLGRRPVMLLGAGVQTVMFALFAMSSSYWLDYAAFIGVGLGGAIYRPASAAMVADLTPAKDRRQVFATFTTANNLGAVLGPALGAVFFFHYREELLWACTLTLLIYSVVMFMILRETKPEAPDGPAADASLRRLFSEQWKGYGVILSDRIFLLYILAGVFSMVVIMQLDLYLAVYITQHVPSQTLPLWSGWGIMLNSTEILGWLLGLNGLLFVLFILPVTRWLRNWKDRNVFVLSALLSGVGTFALGWNSSIWFLIVCTIVFTFGEIVRSPVTQSFISHYAPEHARGQYMGADALQYTIGRFLAPMTVFLSAWISPMGIFSLILLSALISAAFYIALFRVYKAPEKTFQSLDL